MSLAKNLFGEKTCQSFMAIVGAHLSALIGFTISENKKSNIIDFILSDNKDPVLDENGEIIVPADDVRKQWISEYSKVKKTKRKLNA